MIFFLILISAFSTLTINGDLKVQSGELCTLCDCILINHFNEKVEPYDQNQKNGTANKYLTIDCSSDETVGELKSLKWPESNFLGVYGNFSKSKLKNVQKFSTAIRNQMIQLSLAENFIKEIIEVDFNGFDRLLILNLSRNSIETIGRTTFSRLIKLTQLDLSFNNIRNIENESFSSNELTHLNLSHNSLDNLTQSSLLNLKYLKVLDLSYNKLSKLPNEFKDQVRSLEALFLNANYFEKLPDLPKSLKIFDVSKNNLTTLNVGLMDLTFLDISDNQIDEIQEAFKIKNLKVLLAKNNNVSTLSHVNGNQLEELDLSYNEIKNIPRAIGSEALPNLRKLYLDGNPISEIEFFGPPFSKLEIISLSNLENVQKIDQNSFNRLFVVQTTNIPCSNDKVLPFVNISNSGIKEIKENAFRGLPICSIDISYNNLDTISKKLLPWKNLSYVNLQHNPWKCDCDLQWLINDLLPHLYSTRQELLYEARCALPKRHKDKLFVYWLGWKNDPLCKVPSTIYVETPTGSIYEVWTISMIASIILSCLILLVLIAIVLLLCFKPRKRKRPSVRKRYFTSYAEIRTTIDGKEKQITT